MKKLLIFAIAGVLIFSFSFLNVNTYIADDEDGPNSIKPIIQVADDEDGPNIVKPVQVADDEDGPNKIIIHRS